MPTFFFLLLSMLAGSVLWTFYETKAPKIAKFGFVLLVIALAAIYGGYHPAVPGIAR